MHSYKRTPHSRIPLSNPSHIHPRRWLEKRENSALRSAGSVGGAAGGGVGREGDSSGGGASEDGKKIPAWMQPKR